MNWLIVDEIIQRGIKEDIFYQDITTELLVSEKSFSKGDFIVKEDGIVAGIEIAKRVFEMLDGSINFLSNVKDGTKVSKGDVIAEIEGNTRNILTGERLALNFLQRMSGIASRTNEYVERVRNYDTKIVDTRKTIPGMRILEKYAVHIGEGFNHRFNLSDGVLIKDNHIKAVGGVVEAIKLAREKIPRTMSIEIEVQNLDEFKEALKEKPDIIMLDNMSIDDMREAVEINKNKVLLEASGNINLNRVEEVAATGVDIISIGELTHSVKALDISLDIESYV